MSALWLQAFLCATNGYMRPPFEEAWQPRVDQPSIRELDALGTELSDEQFRLMIDRSEQFIEGEASWAAGPIGCRTSAPSHVVAASIG